MLVLVTGFGGGAQAATADGGEVASPPMAFTPYQQANLIFGETQWHQTNPARAVLQQHRFPNWTTVAEFTGSPNPTAVYDCTGDGIRSYRTELWLGTLQLIDRSGGFSSNC